MYSKKPIINLQLLNPALFNFVEELRDIKVCGTFIYIFVNNKPIFYVIVLTYFYIIACWRFTQVGHWSWKILGSPGNQNGPGKLSWKSKKLRKSQQIFKISLCCYLRINIFFRLGQNYFIFFRNSPGKNLKSP